MRLAEDYAVAVEGAGTTVADAAVSAGVAPGEPAAAASDRPGPITQLAAWAERHPIRGMLVALASGGALLAWGHAVQWLAGSRAVGSVDANLLILAAYSPYVLIGLPVGIRIGRTALDTFWPATGWPEAEKSVWSRALSVVPLWSEAMVLAFGALGGVAALLSAPAAVLGPEAGRSTIIVAYLPAFLAGYGLAAVGTLATIRWLRTVVRIHRQAEAIDIFDRGPIYAFSRLTSAVGLAYTVAAYFSLTVNSAFQQGNATSLAFIGVNLLAAILLFVVPMWGIHGRLARQKDTLLREVEARTNRLAAELYARIDAGQLDSTKVVLDALPGTTALRERIERLPTWPWPPNLLRGFVSALLVPLVIYVLTRVLSDLI